MVNAASAGMVVVIDDDPAIFKGIARVAKQAGFVAESLPNCQSLANWIDLRAPLYGPCCLVVDVRSLPSDPEWYSNEYVRTIPKICVGTHTATMAMGPLLNSFQGQFVRKPFTLAAILAHIQDAFALHASLASVESENRSVVAMFALLTQREHEVAKLVGSGSSNLDIAGALEITLKTVKAHRAKVMKKTQSGTIADFVRKFERYRQAALKLENGSPMRSGRPKAGI